MESLDQNKHQNEIESTRKGGFGGSDAKLFLSIAEKGVENLSRTYQERIAVAMGLREYKSIRPTQAMINGHRFEDILESVYGKFEREYLIEGNAPFIIATTCHSLRRPENFKIFAHADYYDKDKKEVFELKFCPNTDTLEVERKYQAQLQWYYMLGVNRVNLVHGFGAIEDPGKYRKYVEPDREIIDKLNIGVRALDQAIANGWRPQLMDEFADNDVDTEIRNSLELIERLTDEIKYRQEKLDAEKEALRFWMELNNAKKLDADGVAVSYVSPSTTKKFDSAKFKAENPDLYNQYTTEVQRESFIKINIKK